MTIASWPKIYGVAKPEAKSIFSGPVEVTEKIDGSQLNWGLVDGKPVFKSKRCVIDLNDVPDLFRPSVAHLLETVYLWEEDLTYHGEAVCRPKHNTLQYDRVPLGNTVLYGILDGVMGEAYQELTRGIAAKKLGIDAVPVLYYDQVSSIDQLKGMIKESYLGGAEMEGVVVKNYELPCELYGRESPLSQAKYVTERFQEQHIKNPEFAKKGDFLLDLGDSYCTEARWIKSIQRMADEGKLTNTPADIGPLLGFINQDLKEEEAAVIKEKLFKQFWKVISQRSVRGFPQWYKERLLDESINSV